MATDVLPVERFVALSAPGIVHGFVGRVPGIDVNADRKTALERLEFRHREARRKLGLGDCHFVTAEQVHGNEVALMEAGKELPSFPLAGVDGLVTNRSDVCLGIYVADCCAVFLFDPVRRAIGLVHAGKKGTDLGIARIAVQKMRECFATEPQDLVVQLSPCIRPPWYEVDFVSTLTAQCRTAGVVNVTDEGVCTATNSDRYYSYRREKGRTGRMLALLALA